MNAEAESIDPELADLLEAARRASPLRRIEWRDRIAAHGGAAIEAVRPWLVDQRLGGFAIRVIQRAGMLGDADLAARVIRSTRPRLSALLRADAAWALKRLRPRRQTPGAGEVTHEAPTRARVQPRASSCRRTTLPGERRHR